MAKAKQAEENHWPGFVDALSTIVMVVTFLLIILAIAIFVMSLRIAASPSTSPPSETSTNMPEEKTIAVEANPVDVTTEGIATPRFQSDNALRFKFVGTTISIDDAARSDVLAYFEKHNENLANAQIDINAFFDGSGAGYTKNRRVSYYRVMAMRNLLMETGYQADAIRVFVREAPTAERVDTVEIYAR